MRDFAQATRQLARADALDAKSLAQFGEVQRPAPRPLPDEATQALSTVLTRRRQLIEMITAEKKRLSPARPSLRKRLEAHIEWLTRELCRVDADLDTATLHNPVWREQDGLLQSMPGEGPGLNRTMLAELPERSTLSSKQLAALVGVAPHNRNRGTLRGKRTIWSGRAVVRTALYIATLVVDKWNPVIKAVYHQLLGRGKAKRWQCLPACTSCLLS